MKFLKIIFLLFLLIFPFTAKDALAQSSVTSSFNPSAVPAAPNQDFTVNIRLNSTATLKVRMYQINMNFDPGKVQVQSIRYIVGTKSDVLGGDGGENLATINASGQIKLIGELAVASPFTLSQGVATSFAELTFISQSSNQYNINILDTSFLKNVKSDLSLETLPVSTSSLIVNQVSPPTPPPPTPPPPTPPPPTPPPAISCTDFKPEVLTQKDEGADGKIYETADFKGAKNIKLTSIVSQGVLLNQPQQARKTPVTAADLSFKENVNKKGEWFINIPQNETLEINEYIVSATASLGVQIAQCPQFVLRVSASPPPPAPPVGTGCFFMDDKPIIGKSCTDADAQAYDIHPKVVPLTLTTAGKKTIFVRFVSNLGVTRDFQRVINFNPSPKLTEVSCTHSLSGSGSIVNITGTALGPRGKGKVKVGAADATIITWNDTTGVITASLDKRIEGKNDIELTRDDDKTARAGCTVGTTSVLFTAQSQCKPSGNFSAEGVSVKIFANAPTTIETEKPEPIIDEKVKLDKDGKPSGFAPKLEKDKKYSLIVKVPGTLSKRVDFETKGGTRNLDSATLLIGDIAPAQNPDGKINAFDRSELTRQWSLVRDVQRSGDFNQDGRVNSIDYACMRQNINQSDETFSPPTGVPSTPSTGVGTTAPSGVGTTTPAGIGTTSPPPAGGPSGTLPFRVSFDPNFATVVAEGDMGTGTVFTLDLTLTGGLGLKSVYVQFFEDGVWGPTPPQTASILLK